MIDLKSILGQNAFFQTNKKIASVVGHDAAALMTYLIEKDGYFSNDQVYKNGKNYFFLLSDDIEKDVYISYKVQKRCILDLEKLGFIETKLMGIPRRLYFTINDSVLLNFMTTINDQKDKAINDQKDKAINDQKASMYNTKGENSYKELNIENLNKEYIDTPKIENLPLEAKKENKEIKNKEIPTLKEFGEFALSKQGDFDLPIDKKKVKLKYDAWFENGWKDGNDKKITNWKSKLINSLQYLLTDQKEIQKPETSLRSKA